MTVNTRDATDRGIGLRPAIAGDAGQIAALHADSWRRHYRGAYSDVFLDGDVLTERLRVWSARLATPSGNTVVAEHQGRLVGFVHAIPDADPSWGSLVDNLHVAHGHQRAGIGSALLRRAALDLRDRSAAPGVHLWVLERNTAAQRFYRALGGRCAQAAPVTPPGGDPGRLVGSPRKLRMVWPDAAALAAR